MNEKKKRFYWIKKLFGGQLGRRGEGGAGLPQRDENGDWEAIGGFVKDLVTGVGPLWPG